MAIKEELGLSTLSPIPGSKHRRKRLGFGEGSGLGKTCGKGNKGARARSGYKSKAGFEGGQMPLYRRIPKFGFTSRKRVAGTNVFTLISLERLEEMAKNVEGSVISLEYMRSIGVVRSSAPKVKILGKGVVTSKFTVEVNAASAGAKAAIEKAGGVVQIVG